MITVEEIRNIVDPNEILLSVYDEFGQLCADLDKYDTAQYDDCVVKKIEFSQSQRTRLILII